MEYELAKELKDAGFPQDGYPRGEMAVEDVRCEQCNDRHHAYAPTLEELIEACDGKFAALAYDINAGKKKFYCCSVLSLKGDWLGPYGHGDSAEEAVARLWLRLNSIAPTPIR